MRRGSTRNDTSAPLSPWSKLSLGAYSQDFHATEAWMLLTLIAQNALTLYAQTRCTPIERWSTPSLRAVLCKSPGASSARHIR